MNICGDNRFEIIEKAKKALIDSTNIEQSWDEMEVLDDFLFRCWQMGWLDKYDTTKKYISEKECGNCAIWKELKWCKDQDLIKREDVWNCRPEWLNENMEDAIKSTHNKGWNKCNHEWCDTIEQIPKAEYRGESNEIKRKL